MQRKVRCRAGFIRATRFSVAVVAVAGLSACSRTVPPKPQQFDGSSAVRELYPSAAIARGTRIEMFIDSIPAKDVGSLVAGREIEVELQLVTDDGRAGRGDLHQVRFGWPAALFWYSLGGVNGEDENPNGTLAFSPSLDYSIQENADFLEVKDVSDGEMTRFACRSHVPSRTGTHTMFVTLTNPNEIDDESGHMISRLVAVIDIEVRSP